MKRIFLLSSFIFAVGLYGCATPSKAPIAADANPEAEIHRASGMIEDASRKQYDRLAPEHFKRAVDSRNAAAEKLSKGADGSLILEDAARSLQAVEEVQKIGDSNEGTFRAVLQSRRLAIEAQAPQFEEKNFRTADKDLANIGEKLEIGDYKLDAPELADLQKRFNRAEIAGRKRAELGSTIGMIEKAVQNGAKKKTPGLYQKALAKKSAAEQAIEVSPHDSAGYSAELVEAKAAARKLTEVLAIERSNGATEEVALTIWNQNQALESSRAALTQANVDSEKKLTDTKSASDMVLADSQANASAEKAQMADSIAAKDARLDQQHNSIAALSSENKSYASEEELKQKIDEIKKTFSADEAEVMKDGKNLVVRLKKMQFSTGRSELNPDSFATLRKVDTLIASVPATQVMVEGHTDSIGTDKKNKALSEQRAEAVKKYLLSQGLSESLKVDTAGYGSDRPLTTNKTKGGRAINRRVDIVIETPVTL